MTPPNIRRAVSEGKVTRAVVVGAGFIGLEMAEALADMWDVETTVVEVGPRIMARNLSRCRPAWLCATWSRRACTFTWAESVLEFIGQEGAVTAVAHRQAHP